MRTDQLTDRAFQLGQNLRDRDGEDHRFGLVFLVIFQSQLILVIGRIEMDLSDVFGKIHFHR